MTEMSLAKLKRVRLRLQKRKEKSKRRKDIARRKMAKKSAGAIMAPIESIDKGIWIVTAAV